MENFYCGDIVEPGTHLTLEDAVHYFNIFNGDIKLSDLSEIEKRLINITKNEESVEPSKENLNELYAMISGQKEHVLCNDDPIECCKNKVNIRTYGWDDKEFKPSVNGVSVKGFLTDGMFCIDMEDVIADGKAYPYGFLVINPSGDNFYGKIMSTSNLMGKDVVFLTKGGDQYSGKIDSGTGSFDNNLEYAGLCMMNGFTEIESSEEETEEVVETEESSV